MKITVIGCGRWGSFIAWYLDKIGHTVTLYGRENSKKLQQFISTRSNGLITLNESVKLSTDIHCVCDAQIIVISVGSQQLRSLLQSLQIFDLSEKTFVMCMKGIEIATGKRITEIVEEHLGPDVKVAVWLGPGHVQEFYRGIPNCMVIDSKDDYLKRDLVNTFTSDLIRFYYGNDLIGSEIGAAAKNVIGIAAGVLDGMQLSSLKGALMSRGTREVSRLIKAMGGNELSAYGLCHLGDYEATVFSEYSHNRKYGEMIVKGQKYTELAEGYYTVKAIMYLADKYNVELPICQAVYDILYNNHSAKECVKKLFFRDIKQEF